MTSAVREEIKAINDDGWKEFFNKLCNNPHSTKPFLKRINQIRGKKNNYQIPTIKFNEQLYETDEKKRIYLVAF